MTTAVVGSGDTTADVILGQLAFTTNGVNFVDAAGLNTPKGMVVDQSVAPNRLYIADTQNNRVLGYSDISLLTTGGAADIVIGQLDFNSNQCNQGTTASATSLCGPRGIAVDSSGNLYVADASNNRVLEYAAPITTGMVASTVFGQGGLFAPALTNTANICNNTAAVVGGLSTKSLCLPVGVALDSSGNLYVADTNNNRVLEYYTPLTATAVAGSGDTTVDVVLGQPTLTTNPSPCNNPAIGGLSANSLCFPEGVALDSAGNLYVADTNNSRVLLYTPAFSTAMAATMVIGQPDLTTNPSPCNNPTAPINGLSANSLCFPESVALDNAGNLYVTGWQ